MKHLLLFSSLSCCLSACSGVDSSEKLSGNITEIAQSETPPKSTEYENKVKVPPTVSSKSQQTLKNPSSLKQTNSQQTSVLERYLTLRLSATIRDAGNTIAGQRPPIYYHPQTGQYYYGYSGAANYYFNQYLKNK